MSWDRDLQRDLERLTRAHAVVMWGVNIVGWAVVVVVVAWLMGAL